MTPEHRRTFVGEGVNTQQQGNDTLDTAPQLFPMRCAAESIFFWSNFASLQ